MRFSAKQNGRDSTGMQDLLLQTVVVEAVWVRAEPLDT